MKATLTFDLDDPSDRINHLRTIQSLDMAIVLFEITHNLNKKCQNNNFSLDSTAQDGIDLVFEEIYNLLEKHNINIDKIIE